jgi:hypothetical protein
MKRFIILLSRRLLAFCLCCCLVLGAAVGIDLINPLRSFAIADTAMVTEAQFSTAQMQNSREAMPYWIWLVLPRLFPEYLDDQGGYLSLGFQWQSGAEYPEGITKANGGDHQVQLTCNACHNNVSSPGKTTSGEKRSVISNVQFNHHRYHQFLANCVQDPRFTADFILPAIEYNHRLSWLEKQHYRWQLIPQLRRQFSQNRGSSHE